MAPKLAGILTLFLAMTVESFAQMALKIGSAGGAQILSAPFRELAIRHKISSAASTWIALGILFYSLEIFLWTIVLHLLDVSIAFPMGSLCFVGVALLSKIFLGERVGPLRWLGVFCILVGTVFLAL